MSDEEIGKRPSIRDIALDDVGNATAEILTQAIRGSVSIYLVAVDDETGEVATTTNFDPAQITDLLRWLIQQHRVGAATVVPPRQNFN